MFGLSKIRTAAEAAMAIRDGAAIGICTLGLAGWPEEVARAIEKRFIRIRKTPKFDHRIQFRTGDLGITRLGFQDLVKRWIAGHMGQAPEMRKLAYKAEAIEHQAQHDHYDGGVDLAILGIAQADSEGNINVTKFSNRLIGCGGFINISRNANKMVFCGTFTAGNLEVAVENGKLDIREERKVKKSVEQVDQVTYGDKYARKVKQPAVYVTEKAVFSWQPEGLV
jgi:acyl CoA:acetate/3-ketoacid CoA transferase